MGENLRILIYKYIGKNFWGYVKNILRKKDTVLPSFNMTQCLSHFTKTLAAIHPNKLFNIPSWIPALSDPEIQFDLDPPSYQQVTNIIRKTKASGSPCPLDQLSIICFKRCPFLRTYLTDLIRAVWLSGTIPSEWKKACTILIHKKGDTNTPSNFRLITLETIPLKVFTSCLRNAMYSFLTVNNFIEHNIQKGFTPNMSGTLEHTAQMANIINKDRIKQRSLVITLLDLKNAIGEVHHNLITSVLDYHHIPEHVKLIIKSLYTDFKTSIITSEFRTPVIPVRRGVLQSDCLSPLLFNMCFNTFIQHIKTDKYRQFGFSIQFLNPVHWFQFADDAAVISSQESENQHLLNRFSIWCQWSNMIIRVDKCSTFGIKKTLTKSIQYLPKLLINKQLIPKINIGEAFQYLGRYFSFNMSEEHHKSELISLVEELMVDIDSKPLHPKNKILLYSRYLLSKLSWHFTVSSVSKTWVTENIDSKVNSYIRKWLDIPISGEIDKLLYEGRVIQSRIGKGRKSEPQNKAKIFAKLVMEGQINSAKRFLNDDSSGGILSLTDDVMQQLREKHPEAQPANSRVLLRGPVQDIPESIYLTINGEMIRDAALRTKGSGGPSGVDANGFKRILACKSFKHSSVALCDALATLARNLCTEYVDPSSIEALVASRLIPLDKGGGGVRPIGVGEVVRRVISKSVMKVVKPDVMSASGSLQLCAGQPSGSEAAIHAMRNIFDEDDTEAILLIDASNAFNSLNRAAALNNIKILCPMVATYAINTYRLPMRLFVLGGQEMKLSEGTTQGDPLSMALYAISLQPLITRLHITSSTKQCWFADDASGAGTAIQLKKWWDTLIEDGPEYGYHPKDDKCWLITKPEKEEIIREIFKETEINITTEGKRHLGAVVGSRSYLNEYVNEKVEEWVKEIINLADCATTQPQASYAVYTFGLNHRWTYFLRTLPDIQDLLQPLEEAITKFLLPALVDHNVSH